MNATISPIRVFRVRYKSRNLMGTFTKNVEARTSEEAIGLFYLLQPEIGATWMEIARVDHYATPTHLLDDDGIPMPQPLPFPNDWPPVLRGK